MNNPLVSIIVPIYKVEPYLRRCLDSIINQTYTNLEIILVDDGSPDACPQICDEYAAKDSRVIVIHKENGGLSDARNAGLDICKGEYISFVDSDDWIANEYIETLLNILLQNDVDMAVSNFIKTSQSFTLRVSNYNDSKAAILNSVQTVKKLWKKNEDAIFVTAWGKLIKNDLYKGVHFPKGKIHEDEYTSYKILYASQKIAFIDIPLYIYFQRDDSIMGKAKPNSLRSLRSQIEKYLFFKKRNELEVVQLLLKNLCWNLLYAYSQLRRKKNVPDYVFGKEKEILFIYRQASKDYCLTNAFSISTLALRLLRIFPILYVIYQICSPIKIRTE